MKRTGRQVYLSGSVSNITADAIFTNGGTADTTMFQNILVDERRGYAYKVTFMSSFPDVVRTSSPFYTPYALQSFSRRELLRMSDTQLALHAGYKNVPLASDNRTIGICGYLDGKNNMVFGGYQNNYVIKGDAMVTQSLSLAVDMIQLGISNKATYYIELDEYEINENEEILLLLAERAQDAAGLAD